MAFMLEAGFSGNHALRLEAGLPRMHLFATCMVALGASLSAFWIMVANSWMQTPAGGVLGRTAAIVSTSFWGGLFNPDMPWGFTHMWVACLEITLFVVGGVSAWYILKDRHTDFFPRSFKVALLAAILIAPLQICLGDGSGRSRGPHPARQAGGHRRPTGTPTPGAGGPLESPGLARTGPTGQRLGPSRFPTA